MQKSGHSPLEKWPDVLAGAPHREEPRLLRVISKDEGPTVASWFARRYGASSGDGAGAPPHHEGRDLLIRVRVRRVRRLGELVLELRADRHVEIQPLGRDLLREPLVVDL